MHEDQAIEQQNKVDALKQQRIDSLRHVLGRMVLDALDDKDVVEIMLNDDKSLFIEKNGQMIKIGEMEPHDSLAIVNMVATAVDHSLTKENPIVAAELPIDGSRFQGLIPPVVKNPVFTIRKKSLKVYTLEDYVRAGIASFDHAEYLYRAIQNYKNILVVGGTGSGKTTFSNALLHKISEINPEDRMIIIEDTQELQCEMENRVFMRESEWTKTIELAQATNRLRPSRITVGEIRKGAPALELLKLWNTGHPGGLCTVHANSAYQGLTRMDQLIQEVSQFPQRELISEAVNVCVFLKRFGGSRRIEEIVEVQGYDFINNKFLIKEIFSISKSVTYIK